jgi:hypothetical protein
MDEATKNLLKNPNVIMAFIVQEYPPDDGGRREFFYYYLANPENKFGPFGTYDEAVTSAGVLYTVGSPPVE